MFVKLENCIKFLHAQGKIPWAFFVDVPAKNMSNMDKLAVNAHDHRKKVIASVTKWRDMYREDKQVSGQCY